MLSTAKAAVPIALITLTLASACGSSSSSSASSADMSFYGGTIQVTAAGQVTVLMTKIEEIKRVAGVKTAFPTYRFDARTGQVEAAGVARVDSIVASDPTEAAWSSLKTTYAEGHAIDADSAGEVVLGSAIAQELNKTIGDSIDLPLRAPGAQPGATSHSFKVVGMLKVTGTAPDNAAYINITDGQMLLKDSLPAAPGDIVDVTTVATGIDVYAKQGASIDELDRIADLINKQVAGVKAVRPSELVNSLKARVAA